MRVKVLKAIKFNGQELAPGRVLRLHPDSVDGFVLKHGNKVQPWPNWPEPLPEVKINSKQEKK